MRVPAGQTPRSPLGDAWDRQGGGAANRGVWSVAALLLAAADALNARLGAVQVQGELSGFTRASSGHCYFNLKDDAGQPALVRCAMFRRAAGLMDFAPADGQRVVVRGRLDLYAPRGELQMVAEHMAQVGAGSLYEEFVRLRNRLEAAGLFDAQRKRALPRHPRTIGVVTSLAAAALRDVASTLARRAPHVRVCVYPSLVQGVEAPPALVQALQTAVLRREVELLLLVRGGGSLEDLWAFNDERVVRAVAACPIPVVSGVGHETDVTLCDLAADVRAATPTAAAELATHALADLLADMQQRAHRLLLTTQRQVHTSAQGLDVRAARLGPPGRITGALRERLGSLQRRLSHALRPVAGLMAQELEPRQARLRRALHAALQAPKHQVQAAATRLQAVHPNTVLHRGYAWVEDAAGVPITSAAHVVVGQGVRAVWADGQAQATVQQVQLAAKPRPRPGH